MKLLPEIVAFVSSGRVQLNSISYCGESVAVVNLYSILIVNILCFLLHD